MPLSVQCPKCRQSYQVQDNLRGKAVQCKCGAKMQIPAASGGTDSGLASWMDEELSNIAESQKQAAEKAAFEAAEEEEKRRVMMSKPTAKISAKQPKGRTLKSAIIRASVTSFIVLILCIGGGAAGVWYISEHPIEGASKEARANKLVQGLGTVAALGMGLPWLVLAFRFKSYKRK